MNILQKIVDLSKRDQFSVFARNAKLMEEIGEFSEALLHNQGLLPHKQMKEPLEGEVADVIICLLYTYLVTNPSLTAQDLQRTIGEQLNKKLMVWERILNERT